MGQTSIVSGSSQTLAGLTGFRHGGAEGSSSEGPEEVLDLQKDHRVRAELPFQVHHQRLKRTSRCQSGECHTLTLYAQTLTVTQFAEKEMRRKLSAKPEIADMIVPTDFAVGCRRPTPGNGYLEALCEDNVTVVSQSIQEITEKGIKTADGVEHEFDIIVCATGFDVSWRPRYPTIGRGGRSLSEEWKEIPSTYLSISVPHFPNYLSTYQPSHPPPPDGRFSLTAPHQSSTAPSVPTATAASCPSPRSSRGTSSRCWRRCR